MLAVSNNDDYCLSHFDENLKNKNIDGGDVCFRFCFWQCALGRWRTFSFKGHADVASASFARACWDLFFCFRSPQRLSCDRLSDVDNIRVVFRRHGMIERVTDQLFCVTFAVRVRRIEYATHSRWVWTFGPILGFTWPLLGLSLTSVFAPVINFISLHLHLDRAPEKCTVGLCDAIVSQ